MRVRFSNWDVIMLDWVAGMERWRGVLWIGRYILFYCVIVLGKIEFWNGATLDEAACFPAALAVIFTSLLGSVVEVDSGRVVRTSSSNGSRQQVSFE